MDAFHDLTPEETQQRALILERQLNDGIAVLTQDNQRLRVALHTIRNELLGQRGDLAKRLMILAAWGLASQEEQEAMQ